VLQLIGQLLFGHNHNLTRNLCSPHNDKRRRQEKQHPGS
jgi:hypothetical protein